MMRLLLGWASIVALLCGASARLWAQTPKLELTIQDGRVTLIARDVPLKDVLQAWARIGDTRIVNGDKMLSSRVTLQLVNTSEAAALDILLRSAAGYIAAPRPADHPGPSRYDRITILVSSTPPAATASPAVAMMRPDARMEPPAVLPTQPSPAYSVPADSNDAQADTAAPMPAPFEGAQPAPSQVRPAASPFAGMHTQLEGAQPKASDWAELMKNQGRGGAGVTSPQTAARPGIIPGGRGGGSHLH
jgi:hypothetical protein